MSATAAAIIAGLNSYKEYRNAVKERERTLKLQELERKRHAEEAEAAGQAALAEISNLTRAQREQAIRQSGIEREMTIESAKRQATLANASGLLGGSQSLRRADTLIDQDLNNALSGSRASASQVFMQLEAQKDAAILRAKPSTLFQLEPGAPSALEYTLGGALRASSAYSSTDSSSAGSSTDTRKDYSDESRKGSMSSNKRTQ